MKPLVIGLIGCGLWGRNILRELAHLNAQAHVMDPNPESRGYADQNGAHKTYSNLADLPEVDGVILSTPASLHAQQIKELIPLGKPIFTEKPFVLSLDDALEIQKLAGDQVFVMHVWRYHSAVQKLKEIIANKQIGEIEQIRTRRCNWTSPRKDVDPIWTLLPHDISIFTELMGTVPTAESAVAEFSESKPTGMIAHTRAGCACVAEVSTRYPEKIREIRVQGSEGVAVMPNDGSEVLLYSGKAGGQKPHQKIIQTDTEPALRMEVNAFLKYLQGGDPPSTRLEEAVEITRCMTVLRSMAGLSNG
ncbi:MAG: Gfo/Idh/MocA family oxidoreductase [Opitutales bacterium]|jgi:predicted dehydrogenase|nr:Gfo/Idh/MocA family oxidoreductase [Opitutales bacterium]